MADLDGLVDNGKQTQRDDLGLRRIPAELHDLTFRYTLTPKVSCCRATEIVNEHPVETRTFAPPVGTCGPPDETEC